MVIDQLEFDEVLTGKPEDDYLGYRHAIVIANFFGFLRGWRTKDLDYLFRGIAKPNAQRQSNRRALDYQRA